MTHLLIIPTATLVAPELRVEFGDIAPAMIPLEGQPAYRHILDATSTTDQRVVLAAHEGIEPIRRHLERRPTDTISVIDVGPTTSLGATVLAVLESVDLSAFERVIVHFADTLVDGYPSTGDVICARQQLDTFRWTTLSRRGDGSIDRIDEKGRLKDDVRGCEVLVGVFAFTRPGALLDALRPALHLEEERDPFYGALSTYYGNAPVPVHEPVTWHDFGHLDTYYRVRQQRFLNKRFFNTVDVDTSRGTIRKTSVDEAKFAHEIQWYSSLPPSLQHVAPRIFAASTEPGDMYVDMEFYGYPPLAESYLHGNWDLGVWTQALRSIGTLLDELGSHELAHTDDAARTRALRAMYETKTWQRLDHVTNDPRYGSLLGRAVVINGRSSFGLTGVRETFALVAEHADLFHRSSFAVVHGDLCLSNVLFDRRTGIVRVIDPRGSFGEFGIHGDRLYDYAKLSHSIQGDYDHLVHGMFDLSVTERGAYLSPWLTPQQERCKELFRDWLLDRVGGELTRVKLIEALLFLSMVPLHADAPEAQVAFLVRGLQTYTDVARRLGLLQPTRAPSLSQDEPELGTTRR